MTAENEKYWIGFDLGGTKMQCGVFDASMKQLGSRRRRTKGELGVEATLERVEATIRKVLDDQNISASKIAGIGIGCPGPVEWQKGIVRVAVNLGWKDVAVGKFLTDKFECPVAVLNDVDAGVYGEYSAGAGKGSRTTLGIFPGTGIGGGCVYDGQILRGKILSCMEIGHIKISSSPRHGAGGMTGTLESEASRLSVAADLAKLAYRGEAPHLLKEAGTDLTAIRSSAIFDAIENGDKEVLRVVESACETIGHAVANMVLLICPDCVVLGGGLVEAMPDLILSEVTKTAKKSVFECYRDEFDIRCAQLGDDAGTVGAAYWIAKIVAKDTGEAKKLKAVEGTQGDETIAKLDNSLAPNALVPPADEKPSRYKSVTQKSETQKPAVEKTAEQKAAGTKPGAPGQSSSAK